MNPDQELLNAYEARELADWKRNKEARQRYENAAKQAHGVRMAARSLCSPVPSWDDMHLGSQRHLVADAENVANDPTISLAQLTAMYHERLIASGDTSNPDLNPPGEICRQIEEMVLANLKETLHESAVAPLVASVGSEPKI